jgi:predicted RNA-binding Zn ribbon-like protein
MQAMAAHTNSVVETALFVGDDLALDFVNTEYGPPTDRHEVFDSDQHVLDWLTRAKVPATIENPASVKRGALLAAALELRAAARKLIERRKAGSTADPAVINRLLALGPLRQELVWKKGQTPRLVEHRHAAGPEAVLVPVAEAVAKLIAEADFDLVRKCESDACTLWFHDRTKSHHRRWCSPSACGNRAKVAAFRARQKP